MKIEGIKKQNDSILKEAILSIFQDATLPMSLDEIKSNLFTVTDIGVSRERIKRHIEIFRRKGYDIREIVSEGVRRYYLARTGEVYLPVWKPMNKIKLPILFTGDWHIGSKGFYEKGIDDMLESVDKYKVKTILHLGDILQGLGVYKKELKDLVIHDIDGQIGKAVEVLGRFPKSTSFHLVIGGHEEVLKGKHEVGLDALSVVSRMCKNVNYYGDRMLLEFDNKYRVLGIHSSGASTLASSYRAERIFNELVEKPSILAIGHTHKLYSVSRPPHYLLLEVGTLQRESSYIIHKGMSSILGYYILTSFKPEETILIRKIIKTE